MFSTMTVQRLSVGTVYKLWFIGLLVGMAPLGVLSGVLALFGFNTVRWNGQSLHSVFGLIAGPFVGIFVALLFTAILGSVAAFGLWLYSKFHPLTLTTKNTASQETPFHVVDR
jgi:uncharacterized membrane protein YgaE (UPF0421/DUF939 family)